MYLYYHSIHGETEGHWRLHDTEDQGSSDENGGRMY